VPSLAFSLFLPQKSRAFCRAPSRCGSTSARLVRAGKPASTRIAMTDFAAARRHMVDGQVRTANVTDLRIIAAMQEVPRERFVPQAALAYLDFDVPVGAGPRRLLKPMVLAKLVQAADLAGTDRVLDAGCATGYSAAVLARVAGQVVALEEDLALAEAARSALSARSNVRVVEGPIAEGWAQDAPYDVILLEGATEIVPETLCRQLRDGGRLVCVLGTGPGAKAMIYYRSGDDLGGRAVFDASAALLPGFAKPAEFAF
jgi:protein-L-isoaspartate(D-aspartate) O-methyltransferase